MVLENLSDWNLAIYDWIESIISDHRCPRYNKVAENCLTLRSSSFTTSSGFGESSNFRQEIRQSYYRNDPVKYGHTTLNISRMDSVGGFFSLSFSWKSHRKRIGTERKFLDMKLNSLPSILTLFKPWILFFKACIWTRLITRSTPMRSA